MTSENVEYDSRFYTLTPSALLGYTYQIPTTSLQMPTGEYGGIDVAATAYVFSFQSDTTINIETSSGTLGPIELDEDEVYYFTLPMMPRGTWEGFYGTKIYSDESWKKIWVLIAFDDNAHLDFGYQALFPEYFGNSYYLPYAPSNPTFLTPAL